MEANRVSRMLCEHCKSLDQAIHEAINELKFRNEPLPARLRYDVNRRGLWYIPWWQDTRPDTSCDLCRVLRSMVIEGKPAFTASMELREHADRLFFSVSGSSTALLVAPPSDTQTRPDGSNEHAGKGISGRVIDPYHVDYGLVRQWLLDCSVKTGITCSEGSHHLAGLKVINCTTRRIVPAPDGCAYVALSYVWGPPTNKTTSTVVQRQQDKTCLGDDVPLTVEDAMVVTRELGFQYLWVDKYCIDQTNDDEKARFVGRMDKIYNDAALTIVAAAGSATTGLPGVSSVPRKQQASISLGGRRFLVFPDPIPEFKDSAWSSRGWTYQEGALSRRILVFTQSQIYFQCMESGYYHWEGLSKPQIEDLGAAPIFLHRALYAENGIGMNPDSILRDINRYTSRQLSYDSDSLNGLLGILRAFQSLQVYHLWGVPFSAANECKDAERGFAISLCWWPERPERARRREQFPSWSWVGWKGLNPVEWPLHFTSLTLTDHQPPVAVHVSQITSASREERLVSLCDHVGLVMEGADPTHISPVINITGLAAKCRILERGQVDIDLPIDVNIEGRVSICLPGMTESHSENIREESFEVIYLSTRAFPTPGFGGEPRESFHLGFIIVCKQQGSSDYTRVGTLQVNLGTPSASPDSNGRDHGPTAVIDTCRRHGP